MPHCISWMKMIFWFMSVTHLHNSFKYDDLKTFALRTLRYEAVMLVNLVDQTVVVLLTHQIPAGCAVTDQK